MEAVKSGKRGSGAGNKPKTTRGKRRPAAKKDSQVERILDLIDRLRPEDGTALLDSLECQYWTRWRETLKPRMLKGVELCLFHRVRLLELAEPGDYSTPGLLKKIRALLDSIEDKRTADRLMALLGPILQAQEGTAG